MWGKVLLLLIPLAFIISGGIFIEQQKKTPDAEKKLLGYTFVSAGVASFLLMTIILVYSHILNNKNESLKYCNTGFDVIGALGHPNTQHH